MARLECKFQSRWPSNVNCRPSIRCLSSMHHLGEAVLAEWLELVTWQGISLMLRTKLRQRSGCKNNSPFSSSSATFTHYHASDSLECLNFVPTLLLNSSRHLPLFLLLKHISAEVHFLLEFQSVWGKWFERMVKRLKCTFMRGWEVWKCKCQVYLCTCLHGKALGDKLGVMENTDSTYTNIRPQERLSALM